MNSRLLFATLSLLICSAFNLHPALADSDAEWGESPSQRITPHMTNSGGWGEGGDFGGAEPPEEQPMTMDGDFERLQNKLNPGSTTEEERAAMVRTGVKREPRLQISEFVNTLGPRGGAPSLTQAHLQLIDTPELQKLCPEWMFYVLRFPRWPVSMKPPEGLSHNNIFIVKKTGRMGLVVGQEELQGFFQTLPAPSESQARLLVYGWLQLVTELIQDGMYRFNILENTIAVNSRDGDLIAVGKASVNKEAGNTGDVDVTLIFDKTGKLKGVEEKNTVQPGARPICQTTNAPVTD